MNLEVGNTTGQPVHTILLEADRFVMSLSLEIAAKDAFSFLEKKYGFSFFLPEIVEGI